MPLATLLNKNNTKSKQKNLAEKLINSVEIFNELAKCNIVTQRKKPGKRQPMGSKNKMTDKTLYFNNYPKWPRLDGNTR